MAGLDEFLNDQKLKTVEFWLQALWAVDTERPIKIMTGWGFQSDGQDLYEKYGAYIQLTGGAYSAPCTTKDILSKSLFLTGVDAMVASMICFQSEISNC